MILGEYESIKEGDESCAQPGKIFSVPVGEEMIGRVINPLGEAIDGKGEIQDRENSIRLKKSRQASLTVNR